jgi:precorrin-6A/cobalt-precorrin-6A reductase
MKRILILGGTTEARLLAGRLAGRTDLAVTVSLAGRTADIVDQSAPTRVGGFGGVTGLAAYLRDERVDVLVDATHPFAEIISAHAVEAAKATATPLVALHRPAWRPVAGDDWIIVPSMAAAVEAVGQAPRRVFLAIGRKEIAIIASAPQHFYLIRSVDPIAPPPPDLPNAAYVVGRGPFTEADDKALLTAHKIEMVVSRNSGGDAGYAKIAAARALRLPVIMVRRPVLPEAETVETVEAAIARLDHVAACPRARAV